MALLQPKLSLKVSQRQILTPGLMQMVSVLALNKLELKEMIDAEMVENPVLEEIDETVPMLDEVAGREERLERGVEDHVVEEPAAAPKDPFNEIDFGSYFQDYLDPGYRTQPEYEENEKPSFENFLSQPTTLADHLAWQLGSLTLEPSLREAVEFIIGNLDEDGYLAGASTRCSSLTLPVWAPATCASACCSRLRSSSRSFPSCLPGRRLSRTSWKRIFIEASAPRPRRASRSGGAAWKWRR
jgi:RNA polymerase sigma-54 factor